MKGLHTNSRGVFTCDFAPDPFVLSDDIVTFEGRQMQAAISQKTTIIFDVFKKFGDDGYHIGHINFGSLNMVAAWVSPKGC